MLISGRWVPSPSLPSRHDPAEDCSNNQPCRCTHGPICGGHHNRGRPVSSWRSACAQPGHARKQRPEYATKNGAPKHSVGLSLNIAFCHASPPSRSSAPTNS
jgi:hypothetical protein